MRRYQHSAPVFTTSTLKSITRLVVTIQRYLYSNSDTVVNRAATTMAVQPKSAMSEPHHEMEVTVHVRESTRTRYAK